MSTSWPRSHTVRYNRRHNQLIAPRFEHREGIAESFTKQHGCKLLVWYEQHETIEAAIQREKSMKRYPRQWKLNLINASNVNWSDLNETLNHRMDPRDRPEGDD